MDGNNTCRQQALSECTSMEITFFRTASCASTRTFSDRKAPLKEGSECRLNQIQTKLWFGKLGWIAHTIHGSTRGCEVPSTDHCEIALIIVLCGVDLRIQMR
jgi:hypothetical protein